jgi:hypothetical protein
MQPTSKQCDVIDLYSMDEEGTHCNCQPFLHYIAFAGPKGEIIRVKALFDKGTMISVMCTTVFNSVKHHLGDWKTSTKRLRMANGTVVPSKGTWKGNVMIAGVEAPGEFEVFDSGGGWKFLFEKPMLQAFKAIHEYKTDIVHITGNGISTTISNQNKVQEITTK